MLKIVKACFIGVAGMESLLILADAGRAEVMMTPIWSLEEVRIVIVVLSLLIAATLSVVTNES